jgi:hypothetical protein
LDGEAKIALAQVDCDVSGLILIDVIPQQRRPRRCTFDSAGGFLVRAMAGDFESASPGCGRQGNLVDLSGCG